MSHDFDPLTGDPLPLSNRATPKADTGGITAETLAKLDAMSKEQLITLIRRVSGAVWGVGLMDDNALADAMLLKLASNGLASADAREALANIREWLDRKQGKSIERHQVDQRVLMVVADEQREAARLEVKQALAKVLQSNNK